MELKEIIANRLYNCRKEMKLSQGDVGKLLSVSDKTIASYEQGRNNVPNIYLLQLSRIYGVSLNYLYGVSDEKQDSLNMNDYTGLSSEYIDKIHQLHINHQTQYLMLNIDRIIEEDAEVNIERTIGNNIRQLRTENEITVVELGKEIGVAYRTLYAVESGERRLKLKYLERIAKYFNRTIEWFSQVH